MNLHSFAGWLWLLWQWHPRLLCQQWPLSPVQEWPRSRATCVEGQGANNGQGLEWTERKAMMPFIISFLLARYWEEGMCYTKEFSTFFHSEKLTEQLHFQKASTFVRNRGLKCLTIWKAPYITVLLLILLTEPGKLKKVYSLNTGSNQTNTDFN